MPDILTEIDGPVARVTFNRPEVRNAVSNEIVTGMLRFLTEIENDPAIRCVVLAGAGAHFSAGGDVKAFQETLDLSSEERRRNFESRILAVAPLFQLMERLPKPIVASVRGAVAGAGVGWVAASDYVLLSDTAMFVVAHIHLGGSPDGGVTWHLPRAVGVRKAKEMAMLGDRISADEALSLGLANRVVADADLDAETRLIAERFAGAPTFAVAQAKRLINAASGNLLGRQLELEAEAFGACAATEDFAEGARAFMEKRKPRFQGR